MGDEVAEDTWVGRTSAITLDLAYLSLTSEDQRLSSVSYDKDY